MHIRTVKMEGVVVKEGDHVIRAGWQLEQQHEWCDNDADYLLQGDNLLSCWRGVMALFEKGSLCSWE